MDLSKPVLIYDGNCGFCMYWIKYWKSITGDQVSYRPYQKVAVLYPKIEKKEFRKSIFLIRPNGKVHRAAEAAFYLLNYSRGKGWYLKLYKNSRLFAFIAEKGYSFIASHRPFFYKLSLFFYGKNLERISYDVIKNIFLKLLGFIYLFAFASLGVQILGLIGSNGILPATQFFEFLTQRFGIDAYINFISIFWFNASDHILLGGIGVGIIFSLLLIAGIQSRVILFLLYILYLSFVSAGQVFMSYQWDTLLLEVGFLSIFLNIFPFTIFLFRWLLFRLMFLSGIVKLLSSDIAWRNFTALDYHFYTQPLPNILSWYAHQFVDLFGKLGVGMMFFIQLFVPFLFFFPRKIRFYGFISVVFLEGLIFMTGNYNFFNLLTLSLALFLLDDSMIKKMIPKKIFLLNKSNKVKKEYSQLSKFIASIFSIVIIVVSLYQIMGIVGINFNKSIKNYLELTSPFGIVNRYGLFAVMTKERNEIIIQGSLDGQIWEDYELKFKPGDINQYPKWAAPHQPRLDWQMWFAALQPPQYNLWVQNFMIHLLSENEQVLKFIDKNPFAKGPPKYIRATMYQYKFSNFSDKKRKGNWWNRKYLGEYIPAFSLSDLK